MFIKLSYDLKKLLKGYFLFLPIPARILFRYSRCLEAVLNFFLAASIISRCTLHTHHITINNCLVHLILDTGKHSHIHRILFLQLVLIVCKLISLLVKLFYFKLSLFLAFSSSSCLFFHILHVLSLLFQAFDFLLPPSSCTLYNWHMPLGQLLSLLEKMVKFLIRKWVTRITWLHKIF